MTSSTSLPLPVAEALQAGAQVLTPNQRSAHKLLRACMNPDAPVATLSSWMQSLWKMLILTGKVDQVLLNATQENVLWREAIAADAEVSALRSVDALADLASSAYSTVLLHEGRKLLPRHAESTDSRAFLRWIELFEQRLEMQRACIPGQLPALLLSFVANNNLSLTEAGVLLVDFDPLAPAHARLFGALEQNGCLIQTIQTTTADPAPFLLAAETPAEEIQHAALWLRGHLEKQPDARLALVVPALGELLPTLDRVLNAVLWAENTGLSGIASNRPYEFSLGKPLSQTSQIATAFFLLQLAGKPQHLQTLSVLLLSPSFGASGSLDEQCAVAEFDAYELRESRRLRPERSLESLLRLAERSRRAERMPVLLQNLRALAQSAQEERLIGSKVRQTYSRWADAFRAILGAAGWTSAVQRSSLGFQVHRRWESALDELSTLDFDNSRPTAAQTLNALARITAAMVFAPESHDAAVQVLGPLEVGGMQFDGVWFLGAGDLAWPATSALNALIPRTLALQLGIPGGSPTEAHERGRILTARIAGSAPEVVISYSKLMNGQHTRPSPALAGLTTHSMLAQELPVPNDPRPMELVDDLPTTQSLPDAVVRGGAGILEHQAACAFRAFAQHRLGSTEPGRQTDGFDHGERGSLVHVVMQLFWEELADQRELRQLSPAERESFLDQCIQKALTEAHRTTETNWDRAYLHTQHVRLRNLLLPWLEQELARPAFAVRTSEMSLEDVSLGPLRFRLRVDRIDETDTGDLILDYKTGQADPREWRSERPEKPQLPLYAVLTPERVAGIAFAQLRPGKGLGLRGFADSADLFGGKLTEMDALTFDEQMDRWRTVLTALAQNFHDGVADVLPKKIPQTCERCSQRILCRLDSSRLGDEEDEQTAEGEWEKVHG